MLFYDESAWNILHHNHGIISRHWFELYELIAIYGFIINIITARQTESSLGSNRDTMNKTVTIAEEEVKKWNLNMPDEMLEAVSSRFKLLAEPMRLKILRILCDREYTVQEIVKKVNASQANISKHLTLMHDNGVVTRRKEELKCYYRIADDSIIYSCYLSSRSVVENLQDRLNWLQKVNTK